MSRCSFERQPSGKCGMKVETASVRDRMLASALYLGLAPFLRRAAVARMTSFVRQHFAQSLVAFATLGILLLLASLFVAVEAYLMVYHREICESGIPNLFGSFSSIVAGLVVLYAWGPGLLQAVRGRNRKIAGISWLCGHSKVVAFGRVTGALLIFLGLLLATTTLHACTLTRPHGLPAKAYMLYDDLGYVPGWIFDLGFYRMSVAATQRWGPGSVIIDSLTAQSFVEALRYSRVVFIASHGVNGSILCGGALISPCEDVAQAVNSDIRLVYIAACDAGQEAAAWERVLAPAKVVTFDRLSAVVEHIWWLWTTGPRELRSMP